ncbi:MAG: hypothetical protein IJQ18_08870 [Paludibacteraceae bacterium]|nr:hypothetical protein [Paludibacteraceae bacterium]
MKKIFTFGAAVLCGLTLNAKTLYLNPGSGDSNWAKDGAVLFVHSWDAQDDDAQFTGSGDVLSAEIPDGNNHVKIVRMPAGSASLNWDSKWNETGDLAIPEGKNLYTITGWGANDGEWSVYGNGGGNENPGGQGGETPGGQGGTQSGAKDYYLRGYFNGVDTQVPTAEELFENGVLADFTFTGDGNGLGYFYVMECDEGQVVGVDYMLTEYIAGTHGTLVKGGNQKLGVQAGTVTFYLYDNGDGSLELSTEVIAGKTLVGGGEDPNQAINQVESRKQVRKMIIDGQLRIVRGEKVFDATGRQL